MSSSNFSTTPTKSSNVQRFFGTSLNINFTSHVALLEKSDRNSQFIKFGNTIIVFCIGAEGCIEVDFNTAPWFMGVSMLISAHLFSLGEFKYHEGDVLNIHGSFCPWGFKTKSRDDPSKDPGWHYLLSTSTNDIQIERSVQLVDPEDIPILREWIGCNFLGRVCAPEFSWLSLKSEAVQFLQEHGVFVEIQYFLNKNTESNLPGTAMKGDYSFCIYLLFDRSARKRYSRSINNAGRPKFTEGEYVYCMGRIVAQLNPDLISRAGHEAGTPLDQCPILVVTPTSLLSIPGTGGSGQSSQTTPILATSQRAGLTQKLQQLSARKAAAKKAEQERDATKDVGKSKPVEKTKPVEKPAIEEDKRSGKAAPVHEVSDDDDEEGSEIKSQLEDIDSGDESPSDAAFARAVKRKFSQTDDAGDMDGGLRSGKRRQP